MDELVDRVSTAANVEPETARKAIALILAFLQKRAPPAEIDKVLDAIPGARTATSGAAADETGGGGFLSGLMGGGGLMGLASQLSGIGLGMGEMQQVGHELFGFARERVGEDTIGAIAGSVPGLGQFV